MSAVTTTKWRHLEPRPKSAYRQLFVKGTRIRADVVYGMHVSTEEPMTPEAIAEQYGLPVEAVQEAITYCRSHPAEIEEDFQREEALMQATGMNEPDYKYHPKPKTLSTAQRGQILGS